MICLGVVERLLNDLTASAPTQIPPESLSLSLSLSGWLSDSFSLLHDIPHTPAPGTYTKQSLDNFAQHGFECMKKISRPKSYKMNEKYKSAIKPLCASPKTNNMMRHSLVSCIVLKELHHIGKTRISI